LAGQALRGAGDLRVPSPEKASFKFASILKLPDKGLVDKAP